MSAIHQYVECPDPNCDCPSDHCEICGYATGTEGGRAKGCRWELAAESMAGGEDA
jgi:hypothetical protein